MRNTLAFALAAFVLVDVGTPMAHAQKGVGDPTGIARQPVRPEVVPLLGRLVEIKTSPCEGTTGRSPIGTHLILETAKKKQLNVHLGPAAVVAGTVAKLTVGQEISVKAFRTEKMKENHYVAQSLTFDKTTVELRDASLQPTWARGNVDSQGAAAGQPGLGGGRGPGWGRGGPGWGRGGPGWGRGGPGWGRGGPGWGRGGQGWRSGW